MSSGLKYFPVPVLSESASVPDFSPKRPCSLEVLGRAGGGGARVEDSRASGLSVNVVDQYPLLHVLTVQVCVVWNRNEKPFPRQRSAGSGCIVSSTWIGPHLSVPK